MTRALAILAVLVAGVCTTAMNWRFSYQLGTTVWDSYTWATFSVALDVSKWLMLPFAALAWRDHKLRSVAALAIWLVATIYSFTAAIGFAALNRETSISERQAQADLHKTLEVMKQSPRWQSSAACADATSPLSKEFCARYAAAEVKLKHVVQRGGPAISSLRSHDGSAARQGTRNPLRLSCDRVRGHLGARAFRDHAIIAKAPTQICETAANWKPPAWPVTWLRRKANGAGLHTVSRPAKT